MVSFDQPLTDEQVVIIAWSVKDFRHHPPCFRLQRRVASCMMPINGKGLESEEQDGNNETDEEQWNDL